MAHENQSLPFLEGGGEMGELTRNYDWASSSIGTPDQWPQSLCTTLGIILHSAFPMFLFWERDLLCFYNDAFRPSLGMGTEGKHPAVGKKGKEMWGDIWDFIGPLIEQVMTTGKPVWFENQLVPFYRNGKTEDIYWTFSYSPAYGDNGQINGVFVTCYETTEAIKSLANAAESENRFRTTEQRMRTLVESAPFPIGVYIGREMRVMLANEAIIKVWGKGPDVIGKLFAEVLPELGSQEVLVQLDQVYTTGIPFHIRNQHLDLEVDGKMQPFYFNYSLTPLFDDSGNVYGVMNTGADVTDLNVAKQKTEQSEKNFRSMILQAPVAMCILLGPSHIIEVANDLMIELWGKPKAAVMHKPVFEALPDAREQGLEHLLSSVYNTGETFRASEHPVDLVRNGKPETVYQNFVYEPYKDESGNTLGVLAISIDVTPQVLARQKIEEVVAERTYELATANIGLKQSNAELAQFAYIASHDLQEPIRKISTYLEMLEQSLVKPDDRSKNYLSKLNKSAARMLTLIRDVLQYSQLSKDIKNFTEVDLQDIIKDAEVDFELLIEQKNAVIQYGNLPVIEAIPLQMSQLFGNLISNSLKFGRADAPPVISVTSAVLPPEELKKYPLLNSKGIYHKIEVRDNGIGFEQQYAEQIFNIFQRLHGRAEYAGTGIGLATCKKIVQNHGGDIFAMSDGETGTVFTIILPEKQKDI